MIVFWNRKKCSSLFQSFILSCRPSRIIFMTLGFFNFAGIGYASVVIVQYINIYYNVILGWAFFYMFASFTSELPWSHCNNPWNTPRCFDLSGARHDNSSVTNTTSTSGFNSTLASILVFNVTRNVSASQEYLE